jgi:hypothetical protein
MTAADKTKLNRLDVAYGSYQQNANATATATGTYVNVPLSTVINEFLNGFFSRPNATTFQATVACVLRFSWSILCSTGTNNSGIRFRGFLNGATEIQGSAVQDGNTRQTAAEFTSVKGSFLVSLDAGNTVQLQFTRTEGVNVNTLADAASHMHVELVHVL